MISDTYTLGSVNKAWSNPPPQPSNKLHPSFWKGKAVKRPEESPGIKPHLAQNEIYEGAEGKNKKPELPATSMKTYSYKGNNDKK